MVKRLDKARKKAEVVTDAVDVTDKEKMKQVKEYVFVFFATCKNVCISFSSYVCSFGKCVILYLMIWKGYPFFKNTIRNGLIEFLK